MAETEPEQKPEAEPTTGADWLQCMADEHQINSRKYESLDRRIRSLERKGLLLPEAKDEKLILYFFGAVMFFEFLLPAVLRVFRGSEMQK